MIKGLAFDANGNVLAAGTNHQEIKSKKDDEIREQNIIVASWINDLDNNQKEFDVSIIY